MLSIDISELELVRDWIAISLKCPFKEEQYLQKIYNFLSTNALMYTEANRNKAAMLPTKQMSLLLALLEWPDMPITSLILISKQICYCFRLCVPEPSFPTDRDWILKSIANLHRIIDTFIPLHTSPITCENEDFEDLYECPNLRASLDVLRLMYITFKDVIPASYWYSTTLNHCSSPHLLKNDFLRWKDGQRPNYALIEYLFLVNLEQKLFLLKMEGAHSMRTEAQNSFFRAMFEGPQRTYLLLTIPRNPPSQLLKCTLDQIEKSPPHLLRRQLRCRFLEEEGVDQGGLRKEFFQLLFSILTDPLFAMWLTLEDGTLWFNHLDPMLISDSEERYERLEEYRLSGILLGLAIYNGILLEVPFSSLLFKFLLENDGDGDGDDGDPISFLYHINPSLHYSLSNLLKVEEGDWDSLSLYWEITLPPPLGLVFNLRVMSHTHEIDEPVSYVDRLLYIKSLASLYHPRGPLIKDSFKVFKEGFRRIHNTNDYLLLNMHYKEVSLLIEGEGIGTIEDWKDLSERIQYENGFSLHSPVIEILWNGFLLLNEMAEWRERFLHFVTGSRKAPIGGLRVLDIKIIKNGISWLLPTSHTCFNTFLLPEYPLEEEGDKEKVISYIKKSLENMTGFGLQ